jgi:hypothetical protein
MPNPETVVLLGASPLVKSMVSKRRSAALANPLADVAYAPPPPPAPLPLPPLSSDWSKSLVLVSRRLLICASSVTTS